MHRATGVLLVFLLVTPSLITVQSVLAQTQPSTPQFTIQVVNHSYQTRPEPSKNPYTGEETTVPGNTIQWQTLDLTVPNEPYNGQTVNEYPRYSGYLYFVRFKGAHAQDWTEIQTVNNYYFPRNSSQTCTVLSFVVNQGFSDLVEAGVPDGYVTPHSISLPSDGTVEFQVQALIGDLSPELTFGRPLAFTGEMSGWSNTQTITLAGGVVTDISGSPTVIAQPTPVPTKSASTPCPTATATQAGNVNVSSQVGFDLLVAAFAVALAVIAVLVVALALALRTRRSSPPTPQ